MASIFDLNEKLWNLISRNELNDAGSISNIIGAYANVVTALTAVLTLAIGTYTLRLIYKQLRHQSHATDLAAFIEIQRDIGSYWEKIQESAASNENQKEKFYFGQLLGVYESTCLMFNDKILGNKAHILFCQFIIESMSVVIQQEYYRNLMIEISNSENTYEEIVKFFRNNRKNYPNHWEALCNSGIVKNRIADQHPHFKINVSVSFKNPFSKE